MKVFAIFFGGGFGACLRWILGLSFNSFFPSIPLGTLFANLSGGFLIGILIAAFKAHPSIPEVFRLGAITGFLGGLTTFSTFSAEVVSLLSSKQYLLGILEIFLHVGGSLAMTIVGILSYKIYGSF